MTLRLVLRTLGSRPVRSVVLACGFGFGIAVMAVLLGVGEVVLEQAVSPSLAGGGDLVIVGASGKVSSARYVLHSVLGQQPLTAQARVASPQLRDVVYLITDTGVQAIEVQAGIPSLEGALGDPETTQVAAWVDAPADRAWTAPDPADILREMDRFHPIPDAPEWADSWAEWLYFNSRGEPGATRFYLTFLVGPTVPDHPALRSAGVLLQLERAGRLTSYSRRATVDGAELLEGAPDLDFGVNRVRLEGLVYHLDLDLAADDGGPDLSGALTLSATPGRSLPPLVLHGSGGWRSGYVVPVLAGDLDGTLRVGAETLPFADMKGYHDHNWGFWRDVTWQWGQVAHEGVSIVYGRVHPPGASSEQEDIPGFLAVFSDRGLLGAATEVRIDERYSTGGQRPESIRVESQSDGVGLTMELTIQDGELRTEMKGPITQAANPADFLQMRASYRVLGAVAGQAIAFTAEGAAETFHRR